MIKNNQNSDSIPRTSAQSDASPVNWCVNLSSKWLPSHLAVAKQVALAKQVVRSISLLSLGVSLQLSFSQVATAIETNSLPAHTSVKVGFSPLDCLSRTAIADHAIRSQWHDELNNEDPDLTGQPGTPDRTQGGGSR